MILDTVLISNEEYYVVEKLKVNSQEYYILVSVADEENVCIRKRINELGEDYLIGLADEEEFNLVMYEYLKKVEK
ncbi:MAG: hypothetical protein IJY25_05270 [Bacilli bacterium]|nr:hypothetical protein [Bacilli bacterium]